MTGVCCGQVIGVERKVLPDNRQAFVSHDAPKLFEVHPTAMRPQAERASESVWLAVRHACTLAYPQQLVIERILCQRLAIVRSPQRRIWPRIATLAA